MKVRIATFATLYACALGQAGEIVIIQPASNETRNEKSLGRTMDKARREGGKPAAPLVVEDGMVDRGNNAERSSRDAQDYLRQPVHPSPVDENTTIILRNAPLTEADKLRKKAAAYAQPNGLSATNRACGEVSLSVGTIGDKTVIERNVNERGNSVVDVNCRK